MGVYRAIAQRSEHPCMQLIWEVMQWVQFPVDAGFFWLTNVDGIKDLWCSSIQFGCHPWCSIVQFAVVDFGFH